MMAVLGADGMLTPLPTPWQSSYAAFNNNPVYFIDPLGLAASIPDIGKAIGKFLERIGNLFRKGGFGQKKHNIVPVGIKLGSGDKIGAISSALARIAEATKKFLSNPSLHSALGRIQDLTKVLDTGIDWGSGIASAGAIQDDDKTRDVWFNYYRHYKYGKGTDYHQDISKLDFSSISASDFGNEVGKEVTINFFSKDPTSDVGLTFGSIRLRYIGNNQVQVVDVFPEGTPLSGQPYYDTYNFNVRWGELFKGKSVTRNLGTMLGSMINNLPLPVGGDEFKIFFSGTAKIGGN